MSQVLAQWGTFFQINKYDDVSWVESWRMSSKRLAMVRAGLAGWMLLALKYKLWVFYQRGMVSRFIFYLANLSGLMMSVYFVSMAVLGWRNSHSSSCQHQLDRQAAREWSGFFLHQLYVVNVTVHPLVTIVYWLQVVRPHHIDTPAKLWKEATLHGLPVIVLTVVDFYWSNRVFISRNDFIVPCLFLTVYGGWLQLAGLLHPDGGRDGAPWHPYPHMSSGSIINCILMYGGCLLAANLFFFIALKAHQWKRARMDPLKGWTLRK